MGIFYSPVSLLYAFSMIRKTGNGGYSGLTEKAKGPASTNVNRTNKVFSLESDAGVRMAKFLETVRKCLKVMS